MTILTTILLLCAIGVFAGVALYFVSKKFHIDENPLYGEVESMLPGANCGGCGFPGCRKLAEKMVDSPTLEGLYCSVGGDETMDKIGTFLGKKIEQQEKKVAVVACAGDCTKRPKTSNYEGISSCAFAASFYAGDTGCTFGCFGLGDCASVCQFGAIKINPTTHLPEVDSSICGGCGQCVDACPQHIISLRKTNKKDLKIYVACSNKDKGVVARKACASACIGCGKCAKVCPNEAITVTDFLANIDADKCKLCRKCVPECPMGAIIETNFPPRPIKTEEKEKEKI